MRYKFEINESPTLVIWASINFPELRMVFNLFLKLKALNSFLVMILFLDDYIGVDATKFINTTNAIVTATLIITIGSTHFFEFLIVIGF